MIMTLQTNPYAHSQEYFHSLESPKQQEVLQCLYTILMQKSVIFSKFLESHPYFEEYLITQNLSSIDLAFLENNLHIIYAAMQIPQDFLPNIIFFNDEKKLCIILSEPFNQSYKKKLLEKITTKYKQPLQFFICRQNFLQELRLALNLQMYFFTQELHENLIADLLRLATRFYASDIHLTLQDNRAVCHLRIDGILVHFLSFDREIFIKISQKLKLLCQIDINETRIPQDGHFKQKIDSFTETIQPNEKYDNAQNKAKMYDIRISFVPTLEGESVVLRIPNSHCQYLNLDSMQLHTSILESLKRNLLAKGGLVLISGPTGSGKSTILYNCLRFLNDGSRKIITIEDPIEQEIHGVSQCQVNEDIQFSFASALKYILRQDPDVIMIGEIRDNQTLEIALRAAITGHLVLSSIHSNDCASSLARLKDLGAKDYLLNTTINCIIAQRLLKTFCPFCKRNINGIYHAHGCHECYHQGFGKRALIQEILDFNYDKQAILSNEKPNGMPYDMTSLQDCNRGTILQKDSLTISLSKHSNVTPFDDNNMQIISSLCNFTKKFHYSSTLKQQAYNLFQEGIISYEESLL
ncbi:general secretion pathway protein GspE [Helicobacter didelphidarum]|uniref:General secretion pathway protein GspE n=1 Tax=Helicobacter didelphidarum TaxID=2040648 RepID=A0A3D8ID78_9HELI|nr:GspE/PulE family protein [Helicobacter didelphidarum]RDU63109.1 general secretion pathway protein GspE [Helicobacter didelphidarum]